VFKLETSYEELEDENEDEMIDSAEVLAPSRLVLSKHLEWEPQGSQSDKFPDGIAPVHDDILIAKLRPGQKLNLEMRCCKGVGATHAKWSPVATATYRLLPQISFKQDVEGELATKLVELCPMNVFDIEDLGGGKTKAVVARERNCSVCRECVREEEWKERVKLERKVDHFICKCYSFLFVWTVAHGMLTAVNVESVGMLPPEVLFLEAVDVLKHKCNVVMGEIGGS
jgi:DNA-directed RNA polymerase I and III subunit RPAC1